MLLKALKCDLRDEPTTHERLARYGQHTVQYDEGLTVARRIRASRYLGLYHLESTCFSLTHSSECSSKHNRGVNEVFYEAARVSLSTRAKGSSGGGCVVMWHHSYTHTCTELSFSSSLISYAICLPSHLFHFGNVQLLPFFSTCWPISFVLILYMSHTRASVDFWSWSHQVRNWSYWNLTVRIWFTSLRFSHSVRYMNFLLPEAGIPFRHAK